MLGPIFMGVSHTWRLPFMYWNQQTVDYYAGHCRAEIEGKKYFWDFLTFKENFQINFRDNQVLATLNDGTRGLWKTAHVMYSYPLPHKVRSEAIWFFWLENRNWNYSTICILSKADCSRIFIVLLPNSFRFLKDPSNI